jgi:nucleoside-diphosphate-sugar epimerase
MTVAVVSGGAGFIGSHLCRALLESGHEVVCLDNLVTGTPGNIAALRDSPRFRFVEIDVARTPGLEQFAADARYVIHLASPASVPDYLSRPLETLQVNSAGTQAMLELARSTGAAFLFASTSEIYGNPLEHPQREDYWGNVSSVGIRSCYDEGKRFGEALTMAYVRTHDVDARIIRIFNTYGPHSRADDGRLVPNFVTQALSGQPLTIYGDGTQTRSLCYVDDLVDGIIRTVSAPGQQGEIFNLGNPREQTILDLARAVCDSVGITLRVRHLPLPEDDPTRRQPDITKARRVLHWEPHVDLDEGMTRTVSWFRAQYAESIATRG